MTFTWCILFSYRRLTLVYCRSCFYDTVAENSRCWRRNFSSRRQVKAALASWRYLDTCTRRCLPRRQGKSLHQQTNISRVLFCFYLSSFNNSYSFLMHREQCATNFFFFWNLMWIRVFWKCSSKCSHNHYSPLFNTLVTFCTLYMQNIVHFWAFKFLLEIVLQRSTMAFCGGRLCK